MSRILNISGLALLITSGLFAQSYEDSGVPDAPEYSLLSIGNDSNDQSDYSLLEEEILVDPITVIAPQQNERYARLTPQAVFQNVGSEPARDFYCYCEINPIGYSAPTYIDSFAVSFLDLDANVKATFAQWFAAGTFPYQAKFYAGRPAMTGRSVYGIISWVSFQGTASTGVEELADIPAIELACANPVTSRATINYSLLSPRRVNVSVYDVNGALVSTLYDGYLAGKGSLVWWGTGDAPEGIYFVCVAASDFTKTLKLILYH